MKPIHYKLLSGILALGFISLSCQLPGYGTNNSKNPNSNPIETAGDIIDSAATQAAGDSKSVSVTLTEAQINSLMTEQLDTQAKGLLSDANIDLKQGQIILSGKVNQGILAFPVKLVLEPYIDQNGIPNVNLVNADLGPIPVPEGLNQQISAIFSPILAQAISSQGTDIKLESIEISEDSLTISGQRP